MSTFNRRLVLYTVRPWSCPKPHGIPYQNTSHSVLRQLFPPFCHVPGVIAEYAAAIGDQHKVSYHLQRSVCRTKRLFLENQKLLCYNTKTKNPNRFDKRFGFLYFVSLLSENYFFLRLEVITAITAAVPSGTSVIAIPVGGLEEVAALSPPTAALLTLLSISVIPLSVVLVLPLPVGSLGCTGLLGSLVLPVVEAGGAG